MKRLLESDTTALEAALHAIEDNQVIAAPTETVYGLMARWESPIAREEIYRLKHRPATKRLQMLVASVDDLKNYHLKNADWIEAIAKRFWPGPLTLVVETRDGETIGVRIPQHPFVLELIKRLGEPLAATSANLSGQTPAATADDAVKALDGTPELLIDGGIVTVTGGTASTVASIVGRKLAILREGNISLDELQQTVSTLP